MVKNSSSAISWEAEEYIVQQHNYSWYAGLAVVTALLAGFSIWQHWWSFLVLILLSAIAIVLNTVKPARKLSYELDKTGLTEGKVLHRFDEFKAFGIVKEGEHFSAVLVPKKRFGLQVKVYFPEKNGEEIVDALGARLPMEDIKMDFLDKIVKFLRI